MTHFKCTVLIFDKCIQLHNHQHIKIQNIFNYYFKINKQAKTFKAPKFLQDVVWALCQGSGLCLQEPGIRDGNKIGWMRWLLALTQDIWVFSVSNSGGVRYCTRGTKGYGCSETRENPSSFSHWFCCSLSFCWKTNHFKS